jgi:hypothetical protein
MALCYVELGYGKIIMNNELVNVRRKEAMTFYEVLLQQLL